ncbi:MAG: peroxidase family protein [Verrucomicrobiota bacterium]
MKTPFLKAAVIAGPLALTIMNGFADANNFVAPIQPPSKAFAPGDRIVTSHRTRVWVNPPTAGAYAGEQKANAAGRIVEGPVRAADVWWWKVDFDTLADGWTIERDLRKAGAAPVATPTPPATGTLPPAATFTDLAPANGAVVNAPQTVLRGRITHDIYGPSQITASLNGNPLTLDANGNFAATVRLVPGNNDFTLRASTPNPRQQTTQISAYLDASMVYGSDAARANALRTFNGGTLKTSTGNLPPLNTGGLANANDAHLFPDNQLFLAGDIRANENLELTAIHTLFVREHNLLAAAVATANRGLNDEQIYQQARRLVVAEIQAVTYREFLPALLGPNVVRPYAGYNPDVNAGIATEFSTGAFRIGHTLINDEVQFLDNNAKEIRAGLPLAQAFFNPKPLQETGPDPLLKYLATDNAQEVDTQLVEGLRDFLFGPPGAGGLDLASLNIQRGRDHGLPDYNTVRRAYGLPPVTAFAQITSNPALQAKLVSLYGNVNSLDLWVAGLAEDHVRGSSVGPTFQRIIANQFERTRDGDRNWYERTFAGRQLAALQATRLSDIIRRNTTITKIQDNVFFFDPDTTLAGLRPKPSVLPPDLFQGPGPINPTVSPASLDGRGNNLLHPAWGSAGADLLRFAPAAYEDGVSSPAGSKRPGARLISNTVSFLTTPFANDRLLSSWVYGWGQFIDHDLDLTTTGDTAFDIPVPVGDPSFDPGKTGTEVIPLSRSNYDTTTGSSAPAVTEQVLRIVSQTPPPKR